MTKKKHKDDQARKKEAEFLGVDKPLTQYPQIDYYRCIGCGACIKACPEGGILGLVNAKATIINGLKCVGHGLCAEACPVNGIKVGLGDIKSRPDIPILSENNETNIPGLYIAGELGGLALIKNAITQGNKVIEQIASKQHDQLSTDVQDVIIVGAGPAGLSAALSSKKHDLKYLLLDQQTAGGTILQYPRKKVVMTRPVELPLYGWLDKGEYSKEELLDIWEVIQSDHDLAIKTNEKLIDVKKNNGHFQVVTDNSVYKSSHVLLALGRRGTPRKLQIPGEQLPKVMYKLMDAESYENENILIIGGGDSAVEAAIGLANQAGNTVTLSYRKPKFFRIKTRNEERIQQIIKDRKINVIFNSEVTEIGETYVKIQSEHKSTSFPNSYVFIFAGGEPPFPIMHKIGIKFGGELECEKI
jgi:putative YpdA family bacillithiol system oxidoreductase